MSISQPWPFYPDFQNISGTMNASGALILNTKFRRVDSAHAQLLGTSAQNTFLTSGPSSLYVAVNTCANGQVAVYLQGPSGMISSAIPVYVWATGIM